MPCSSPSSKLLSPNDNNNNRLHGEYVELTTSTLGAHSVFKTRLHAAFVSILNNHHPPKARTPLLPSFLFIHAYSTYRMHACTSADQQNDSIL